MAGTGGRKAQPPEKHAHPPPRGVDRRVPDAPPPVVVPPIAGPTLPAGLRSDDLVALQRLAGNAAAAQLLRRPSSADGALATPVLQRRVSPAERTQLLAAEAALDQVSSVSAAQSTQFGSVGDTALDQVNAARTQLTRSNTAYEAGHQKFTGVLASADKEYEFDKSVEDAVQGIFVAAALAVVAPEAIITVGVLRAAASSTSSALTTAGLAGLVAREATVSGVRAVEGAIGEGFEIAAGKGVDAVKGDGGPRPSDSAAGGGASAGDKFKEAFGQLDALVGALPRLGSFTSATGAIARAAEQLARESTKLRNGESAKWTAAEIVQKVALLQRLRDEAARSLLRAQTLAASVRVMSAQITDKPVPTPVEVEDRLWTQWMAGLGVQHDMLDNDVLEEYLGPKGKNLFDFGSYTSDADERGAIAAAQVRWLEQNGLTPGPHPETQYLAEMAVRRVRSAVVGKRGTISGPGAVTVEGRSYTYAKNSGTLPTGTAVVALHAVAPEHYQSGTVLVAAVSDTDVEVYCNRADEVAAPQTMTPLPAPP